MKRLLFLFIALAGFFPNRAAAQYYNNGQDPFRTRWRQSANERYRLLYPEENESDARRVALVLDTSYHALHFGFSRRAARLPIILHTQNLRSNGVVTWTPKRGELIITPPTETFATPWLKQLSVHEYRHVVQMSNLNRHTIRFFAYLLGEQAVGASAIFLTKWFLEGDAVLAETSLSAYGRAMQPEFTLGYRAYLAEAGAEQFSTDKWFCGSFRDFIPNHYYMGYQMTNAGYKKYGPDVWDNVFEYVAKHPFFIFPRPIAFKRFYKTSSGKLFRETFSELKAKWDALPPVEESMETIATPVKSYTIYSYPVPVNDTLTIAHKYDFVNPDRLVAVNPETGQEKVLLYTGALSSRPVLIRGEIWWTEYKASTFWEQKNRSVLRRMPLDGTEKVKTISNGGNLFYATQYGDGFAAVNYDPVEKYTIEFFDPDFTHLKSFPVPDTFTVHGMAWDEPTNTLALITLSEEGMALTGVIPGPDRLYPITAPSSVTINHLSAGGGKLFFNSIQSGRDESHLYDLTSRKEYRITTSAFGSVMPSPAPDAKTITQATYHRGGYSLSTQSLHQEDSEEITSSEPVNLFNLPVYDFGLPNLDDIELYAQADSTAIPSKRYRKGTHLFHFHSWAPLSFNVLEAANDRNLDMNAGATLVTQNALGNTEGYLSYGYVNGNNWWRSGFRFLALAPKFEINAEYDGGKRGVIRPDKDAPMPPGAGKKYVSIEGTVYLPVNLSSGGTSRSFVPSVKLKHLNTMIYQFDTKTYTNGYEQTEVSLSYAQNRRMAYRDLAPRWGFGIRGVWTTAPFNASFGSLWSLYGNLYLPGIMNNHSFRLRGAVQRQEPNLLNFSQNILFPRGCKYDFSPESLGSVLVNYCFPVAYPDWGINEAFYIKRISADLFGGYSRYNPIVNQNSGWQTAYSYGGEVSVDFSPFGMGGSFTLRTAIYKTNEKNGLNTGVGLSIAL